MGIKETSDEERQSEGKIKSCTRRESVFVGGATRFERGVSRMRFGSLDQRTTSSEGRASKPKVRGEGVS